MRASIFFHTGPIWLVTGDEPQSGLSPPANNREFTVIKLLVSPLLILMTFSEQGNKFNSSGLNEQRRRLWPSVIQWHKDGKREAAISPGPEPEQPYVSVLHTATPTPVPGPGPAEGVRSGPLQQCTVDTCTLQYTTTELGLQQPEYNSTTVHTETTTELD